MKLTGKVSLFLLLWIMPAALLHGYSAFRLELDRQELELELDMYYTNIDYYVSFLSSSIPYVSEENELEIYKSLMLRPLPGFAVLELSIYPMPWLGVWLKREMGSGYYEINAGDDANLIDAVCSGFQEPYAVSLFLGNVVSFWPHGRKGERGRGLFGLLVSAGDRHIKNGELVDDDWLETELKVKGTRITAGREMDWSFRVGAKFHGNVDIKTVYYLALKRDRTDFDYNGLSFLKNTSLEYIFDLDRDSGRIIRHYFLAGKKYPFRSARLAFDLRIGFVWEGADKYSGALAGPVREDSLKLLIYPNLKF